MNLDVRPSRVKPRRKGQESCLPCCPGSFVLACPPSPFAAGRGMCDVSRDTQNMTPDTRHTGHDMRQRAWQPQRTQSRRRHVLCPVTLYPIGQGSRSCSGPGNPEVRRRAARPGRSALRATIGGAQRSHRTNIALCRTVMSLSRHHRGGGEREGAQMCRAPREVRSEEPAPGTLPPAHGTHTWRWFV